MKIMKALFVVLTCIAVVGALHVTAASKKELPGLAPGYNRQECSGSNCTFVATWMERGNGWFVTEAILSMSTFALEFGIEKEGALTTSMLPGDSFTIPIDASGEIVGYAARFEDSPPITFEPNGVVHAETAGLGGCNVATNTTGGLADIAEADKRDCKDITLANDDDIIGTWADKWTAYDNTTNQVITTVSCATAANGLTATCTSTEAASGPIRLELERTVDNFIWQYEAGIYFNGAVPVLAIGLDTVNEGEIQGVVDNPFPGTMKSAVTVTFPSPTPLPTITPTPTATPSTTPTSTPPGVTECSDNLDNDGDGLVDCEDYGCLTDVEDPNSCDPTDNDETDIPGFDPGPFQEQD